MPGRPPLRQPVAAGLALLLLSACSSGSAGSSAVAVPVPTASAPLVLSTCRTLIAALPATLGSGLRRRPVTGDPTRTAAWGQPPVTLQCGVALPVGDDPPVQIGAPDGGPLVSFSTHDVGGATRFTTSGTAVTVSVTVPDADDSTVLVPLTVPLRALPTPAPAPGS